MWAESVIVLAICGSVSQTHTHPREPVLAHTHTHTHTHTRVHTNTHTYTQIYTNHGTKVMALEGEAVHADPRMPSQLSSAGLSARTAHDMLCDLLQHMVSGGGGGGGGGCGCDGYECGSGWGG